MKLPISHLVVLSLTALLFIGCSGERSVPQPAPKDQPGTRETSSNSEPGTTATEPGTEPTKPDTEPAVPEPGEPGSIKGVVKSPYTRLAQAAVFIVRVDGLKFQPAEENAVMDQKNLIFLPHVLPILVGTTVDFPNSDIVRHNVYTFEGSAQEFNLGQYDVGVTKHVRFDKLGVTQVRCNVHAEMSAFIVVCQNPFFAVTDGKGNFAIPDVPPGKWQLRLFHEKLKEKTIEVVVQPEQETGVEFTKLERR